MRIMPPGRGGIATDKVGELGTGYIFFYELTGDTKYRDAAIDCATALARHVRPGDADPHSVAFSCERQDRSGVGKGRVRREYCLSFTAF